MVTEEVHRCDHDCPPVGVGGSVPTGEVYRPPSLDKLEEQYIQACRNSNQSLGLADIYEIRDLVTCRDAAYALISAYRVQIKRLEVALFQERKYLAEAIERGDFLDMQD